MPLHRLAALIAAAVLALPAVAGAQSSPFAPLPQRPPEPVTVQDPPSADDNDLGGTETLLVLIAAGGLLGGIAWFVVRDARGRAPVLERDGRTVREGADERERLSAEHRKAKARNRAAAKRARASRKKHRKR